MITLLLIRVMLINTREFSNKDHSEKFNSTFGIFGIMEQVLILLLNRNFPLMKWKRVVY